MYLLHPRIDNRHVTAGPRAALIVRTVAAQAPIVAAAAPAGGVMTRRHMTAAAAVAADHVAGGDAAKRQWRRLRRGRGDWGAAARTAAAGKAARAVGTVRHPGGVRHQGGGEVTGGHGLMHGGLRGRQQARSHTQKKNLQIKEKKSLGKFAIAWIF